MLTYVKSTVTRWWLKRQIALVHYRREELRQIIAREMEMLDYEEHDYNARLRELQHRELNARLGEVRA